MKKTKIIFENQHLAAAVMANGKLVVTSKHKQMGKIMDADIAAEWIDAIKTAIDATEAHALCKSILTA